MRKKLVAFKLIALSVVLVMAVVLVFAGCSDSHSLIRPNEERSAKQATAIVSYGSRQGLVDKMNLLTSFYNYYNTIYSYYYNQIISAETFSSALSDIESTFDDANESLAKNALFKLYCIEYLGKQNGRTNSASTVGKTYDFSDMTQYNAYVSDRIAELDSLLTIDERNEAIFAVNSSIKSQFEEYVTTVTEERAATEEEEEPTVVVPSTDYITSVEITTLPRKLTYELGEALSVKGMIMTVNYANTFADTAAADKFLADNTIYTEVSRSTVTDGVRLIYKTEIDNYATVGSTLPDITTQAAPAKLTIELSYGKKIAKFDINVIEARTHRTQAEELTASSTTTTEDTETIDDVLQYDANGKAKLLEKFSFDVVRENYETLEDYKIAKEAMARLQKNLSDNFVNYNYYYLQQLETKLTAVCQDLATRTTVTEDDINSQFAYKVTGDLTTYSTESSYNTAVKTSYASISIAYKLGTDTGAFFTKQILFPFNVTQNAAITALSGEKVTTDDSLQAYRENLAKQITVWLSNPDFVASEACTGDVKCEKCNALNSDNDGDDKCDALVENEVCGGDVTVQKDADGKLLCSCPLCENYRYKIGDPEYVAYPNLSEEDIAAGKYPVCPLTDCACKDCPSNEYVTETGELQTEAINVLDLVGTDKDGLGGKIAQSLATVVRTDYATDAAYTQALIDEFDKWIYRADALTKSGMSDVLKTDTMGALGLPEGYTANTTDDVRLVALVRELAAKGLGSYGWCVTTEGIRFVMVTGYAGNVATIEGYYASEDGGYYRNGTSYTAIDAGYTEGAAKFAKGEFCSYAYGGYAYDVANDVYVPQANGGWFLVNNGLVVLPVNYVTDVNAYNDNTKTYITKDEYDRYLLNGEKTVMTEVKDEETLYYYASENYKVFISDEAAQNYTLSGTRTVFGEDGAHYYYVANGTLEYSIFTSVLSNKQSDFYNAFQKDFYDRYLDDEGAVKYFNKAYKDSIKEIDEQINGAK